MTLPQNIGYLSQPEYAKLAADHDKIAKAARYSLWYGEPKPLHSFDHFNRVQYWEYMERTAKADAARYRRLAENA